MLKTTPISNDHTYYCFEGGKLASGISTTESVLFFFFTELQLTCRKGEAKGVSMASSYYYGFTVNSLSKPSHTKKTQGKYTAAMTLS